MTLFQSLETFKDYFLGSIIIILLLLLILFGTKSCEKSRDIKSLQSQLVDKTFLDSMIFTTKTLKDSTKEITQTQLLADKDNKTVKDIQKQTGTTHLQSYVKVVTEIKIVHDTIKFSNSEHLIRVIDSLHGVLDSFEALPLPANFVKIDSTFQIDETITTEGLIINHLKIPNTTTITIADQKKSLFKTEPVVKIHFSNPKVETEDVKNIVVKPKISKQTKTLFIGLGIGIPVGAILTGLIVHYLK